MDYAQTFAIRGGWFSRVAIVSRRRRATLAVVLSDCLRGAFRDARIGSKSGRAVP
jgi:hypothetical protein